MPTKRAIPLLSLCYDLDKTADDEAQIRKNLSSGLYGSDLYSSQYPRPTYVTFKAQRHSVGESLPLTIDTQEFDKPAKADVIRELPLFMRVPHAAALAITYSVKLVLYGAFVIFVLTALYLDDFINHIE